MASRDAIETAVGSPIDWAELEQIVYEILVNDDMPSLIRLGGVGDGGADAIEESFYKNERRIDSVVQTTSETTQRYKLTRTLARLSEAKIITKSLVIVFRHPVTSEIRSQMIDKASESGIVLEVRDRDYLVTQLGKIGSTVFTRHFGSLEEQLKILMAQSDPLEIAASKYEHAMLATLGAFLINPQAKLARSALFQKTVLAAIAAEGRPVSISQLLEPLIELLPEEKKFLTEERIRAAVDALVHQSYCSVQGDNVVIQKETMETVVKALAFSRTAYTELVKAAIDSCTVDSKLNDAKRGFLERNIRSALLLLVKAFGPIANRNDRPSTIGTELHQDLRVILSRDLDANIAKHALAGIAGFIERKENLEYLDVFVKSYSALAIRNLDPIGRKWQQAALERSVIALDTDATLTVIIEELPDHKAMLDALKALSEAGAKIVIPEHVLLETWGHISRADRTYKKFSSSLPRLSPAAVDENVWHLVVRGYYYSGQANGFTQSWDMFLAKYYDRDDPSGYIKHILTRRLSVSFEPLDTIPNDWLYDHEQLSLYVLKDKERGRFKAQFRGDSDMEERTRRDVKMALNLAQFSAEGIDKATGYLVSLDSAFRLLQLHTNWGNRPKVHVNSRAFPSVASMVCGTYVHSDTLVRLLLNPIIGASAQLLGDELETLARVGVDMRSIPLDRLDWDLSIALKSEMDNLSKALSNDQDDPADDILKLARSAQGAGYQLEPRVLDMVQNYDALQSEVAEERRRRIKAQDQVIEVGRVVAGASRKGITRLNKALRDLGIDAKSDNPLTDKNDL